MKSKSLLFVCGLGLMSSLFAENRHVHPDMDASKSATTAENKAMVPGYCEVEIINSSYDNVTVTGRFDDGSPLIPFNIYSFERPYYISLFYYGYCHRDIFLDIVTFNGYHVYTAYTPTESTVRIVPYLTNQVKAEVHAK
jgi:hypothetical protein